MRAYELAYSIEDQPKRQYAETQKDAKTKRREIMEQASLKITDIAIEQVEIPTKKTEFIAWLNTKSV
jgi:hypothetical protein